MWVQHHAPRCILRVPERVRRAPTGGSSISVGRNLSSISSVTGPMPPCLGSRSFNYDAVALTRKSRRWIFATAVKSSQRWPLVAGGKHPRAKLDPNPTQPDEKGFAIIWRKCRCVPKRFSSFFLWEIRSSGGTDGRTRMKRSGTRSWKQASFKIFFLGTVGQ